LTCCRQTMLHPGHPWLLVAKIYSVWCVSGSSMFLELIVGKFNVVEEEECTGRVSFLWRHEWGDEEEVTLLLRTVRLRMCVNSSSTTMSWKRDEALTLVGPCVLVASVRGRILIVRLRTCDGEAAASDSEKNTNRRRTQQVKDFMFDDAKRRWVTWCCCREEAFQALEKIFCEVF